MKRNTLNFVIDLLALLLMWGLLTTGLLIKYVLPPGSGHWLAIGGRNRHDWGDIHFWLAVGICTLMVVHVLLHWPWVCGTVRRFFTTAEANGSTRARRGAWGVGLIVMLAASTTGLLLAGNAATVEIGRGGAAGQAHRDSGRGQIHWPSDRADTSTVHRNSPSTAQDVNIPGGARAGHLNHLPGGSSGDPGRGADHHAIRGASTLAEVAQVKGISVEELRRRLGLPATVPAHERIGRLGRQYGFTVPHVRTLTDGASAKD